MHKRRGATVKGHFRAGTWISPHIRSGTTVHEAVQMPNGPDARPNSLVVANNLWSLLDSSCGTFTCPHCSSPICFIRHNGSAVWLDALEWPWPLHPCLGTQPPEWLTHLRDFTFSRTASKERVVDFRVLVGIAVKVLVIDSEPFRQRILMAFDAGPENRMCLEIYPGDASLPKIGDIGSLSVGNSLLAMTNFQTYPVLSFATPPQKLGLPIEWFTYGSTSKTSD